MASKRKTRVGILYNHSMKELFSIRACKDNSLVLIQRNEQYIDGAPIKVDRFSIHPSPKSGGTTIKRTTRFENHIGYTSAMFIENSKNYLLAPVFSKTCPTLTDRYLLRAKPNDKVVTLGSFNTSDRCTLIFSVLVAKPGLSLSEVPGQSLTVIDFAHFRVGVYVTYLDQPSSRLAYIQVGATSPRLPEGEIPCPLERKGGWSFAIEEIPKLLRDLVEFGALHLNIALAKRMSPGAAEAFLKARLWFHPTLESLAQGRRERIEQALKALG